MTRGSFFPPIVRSSCLVMVSSFVSILTADDGFCFSGEPSLGVDFPLAPPSCFFPRSLIESTGTGEEYFGTDFPPSMVLSDVIARSNHGGRGAVLDCLPPCRFLIPFSTYKSAISAPTSHRTTQNHSRHSRHPVSTNHGQSELPHQ